MALHSGVRLAQRGVMGTGQAGGDVGSETTRDMGLLKGFGKLLQNLRPVSHAGSR